MLPKIEPERKLTIVPAVGDFIDCLGYRFVTIKDANNNFFVGKITPGETVDDVLKWVPTFPM
jgi:hypothetical protein